MSDDSHAESDEPRYGRAPRGSVGYYERQMSLTSSAIRIAAVLVSLRFGAIWLYAVEPGGSVEPLDAVAPQVAPAAPKTGAWAQ